MLQRSHASHGWQELLCPRQKPEAFADCSTFWLVLFIIFWSHRCPVMRQRHICVSQRHGRGWLLVVIQPWHSWDLSNGSLFSQLQLWMEGIRPKMKCILNWYYMCLRKMLSVFLWPLFSMYCMTWLLLYSFCIITQSPLGGGGTKDSLPLFTGGKITDLC